MYRYISINRYVNAVADVSPFMDSLVLLSI